MRRKAAFTVLILIMVMLCAFPVFAETGGVTVTSAPVGGISIIGTVPENGEEGKQPSNMAVKIIFNEDVSDTANDAANAKLITITDADGETQDFEITHHPAYPDELWCILKGDLSANKEYTVKVAAGVRASSGGILSNPYTFSFKTRNTKIDGTISIVMTIGMMVIMMLATMRSQSKQQEEKAVKGKGAVAVEKLSQSDPYRLAKEKGISVDEAKAQIAKEKEKLDRKNASGARARAKYEEARAAREAEIEKRLKEIHDASVYKVKCRGSLAEHGGTIPKAVLKKQAARRKAKKR